MAEGEELDKSEAATPYKIKKAREKGQVARGMDLGFAGAIAMLCLMGYAGAERMGQALSLSMRHAFVSDKPKLRYPVTLVTHAVALLKRLLPTRAMDKIIQG